MGQFFKQTFASLLGTLAGLLLFFALGASSLVLLLWAIAAQESGPTVKENSVLVFDLATQISDTNPPSTLSEALSDDGTKRMSLSQVLEAIERAAEDERIVALFLDGRAGEPEGGYATLTEIREALEQFRAAGKKIIAYDVDWTEPAYYLSSIADTIALNPAGLLELNGLSSQQAYLKEALDKWGVGVQVVRAGNYKAAVEPFTRNNLSPENRQQLQALLGDLWENFLKTVGDSRQLAPAKLQAIANRQGFLTPEEAQTEGLIDRVAYYDQIAAELKQLGKVGQDEEKSFSQINLSDYASKDLGRGERSSQNVVAVLYAEGTIVSGKGTIRQVGSERLVKELRKLREDKEIKAAVLRIDSPGGSATASEVILREIQLLRERKPVIISMGNIAASGGYWIATGGDQIFAEASTITGSIGVFGLLFNVQKIANNNGLTWDGVKTGQLADITSIYRPKTSAELAIYQKYVTRTYALFLKKVAAARNLPPEKVSQLAQGRVWSGEAAQQVGLVDRLGGLEAALVYAAEKANLGDDWSVEEYPARRSLETEILEKLLNLGGQADAVRALLPLPSPSLNFYQELDILQGFNDPQGIYAHLPFFNWQIK